MYAVVRKYKFDPKDTAEIDLKVREGFIPILREAPGFVAYYWLDAGEGEGASLSIFQTQAETEESVHLAADFVHEHLNHLLGTPEITRGEVRAHSSAQADW